MTQHAFSTDSAERQALRDLLTLCLIPGVGPRTRHELLQRFETTSAILSAPADELRQVPGVGRELSSRIAAARYEIDADREIQLCQRHGVGIIAEADSHYPRLLHEIAAPPGMLFWHGDSRPCDELAMAIVGTRRATHYGIRQAERLAMGLSAAGLTIVSGLARGIDAAAHRAALKAQGRTIAVLGSGVLNVYPPEHTALAEEIRNHGAVISELPPLRKPMSGTFPMRNRLITGLCLGVLVVEAGQRSGALISASHAAEQGREVFAVPGPADSRTSRGCHQLIRDGAKLVESVDDVLDELGPLADSLPRPDGGVLRHPAELKLNDQERQILDAIRTEPTEIDLIANVTDIPIHRVLATISVLEIRHLIHRVSGNTVVRL
ncbi:MAG: DNA-processing protein DprA [Planctomycetota bacterium]